LVHLLIK